MKTKYLILSVLGLCTYMGAINAASMCTPPMSSNYVYTNIIADDYSDYWGIGFWAVGGKCSVVDGISSQTSTGMGSFGGGGGGGGGGAPVSLDDFDEQSIFCTSAPDARGNAACSPYPSAIYGGGNYIDLGLDGPYCYCRLTGTKNSLDAAVPWYGTWVYLYTDESSCATNCARACATAMHDSASFRSVMFSGNSGSESGGGED